MSPKITDRCSHPILKKVAIVENVNLIIGCDAVAYRQKNQHKCAKYGRDLSIF